MKKEEVQELLDLRGWREIQLAVELEVTENAVYKWLNGINQVSRKYANKMQRWLAEARAANGKARKAVVK